MSTLTALAALLVLSGLNVDGPAGTALTAAGICVATVWLGRKIHAAWKVVDRS